MSSILDSHAISREKQDAIENKMDWKALIETRCQAAIQRSLKRQCGREDLDSLIQESTLLLKKQKYVCALCGSKMSHTLNSPNVASLDRIFSSVKKSPDGTKCGYLKNCRWVCWSCNFKTRSCHMKHSKYKSEVDCSK